MVRHSKAQTYLDGRPLISIPKRTIVWQPIETLSPSQRFVYLYIELVAAKECQRFLTQPPDEEEGEGRGKGSRRKSAAKHAKLRALLFDLQRVLLHPSLVQLEKLDTIKRSLLVQERILSAMTMGEDDGSGIPKLRIDDLLLRLQSVGASRPGGMTRDVNRTWAMGGDSMVELREKYEELGLTELRQMVESLGLPVPMCWLQLPFKGTIKRGSRTLQLTAEENKEKEKEGRTPPKATEVLTAKDLLRVGVNDEEYEAVVVSVEDVADPLGGTAALEMIWAAESKKGAVMYKRADAVRKRSYIDLILAKERETRGTTAEIHEAGFAAIYAILQGKEVSCPICLCAVHDATVTMCSHTFCKACILAQLEQAESQGQPHTRCAVCRKPVPRSSLMQIDSRSVEDFGEFDAPTSGPSGASGEGAAEEKGQDVRDEAEDSGASEEASMPADPAPGWELSSALPTVGFPPAAKEEDLEAIPVPFHRIRDNKLPSLEPAFLAHYQNTIKVPSAKVRASVGERVEPLLPILKNLVAGFWAKAPLVCSV
jgi:hypothetical protein